jgi:hypothetical protein
MTLRRVRDSAVRELELIAKGSNPQQSLIIEEFRKCPDWQLAVSILVRALDHGRRYGRQTMLGSPARWLPPML